MDYSTIRDNLTEEMWWVGSSYKRDLACPIGELCNETKEALLERQIILLASKATIGACVDTII